MIAVFKRCYSALIAFDPEHKKVINLIKKYTRPQDHICDMGCGYGRFLKPLQNLGFKVQGVEKNPEIVTLLTNENMNCISDKEFAMQNNSYHTILMSHLVEHFTPDALLSFMDNILDKLQTGGHVIIATPLYTNYFYDDFDHVKPYHPSGFEMVFGQKAAQVQYQSKNRLELVDLWFRRSPIIPRLNQSAYLNTKLKRLQQVSHALGYLMFIVTFGLIGKKDGWVGVFKKVSINEH